MSDESEKSENVSAEEANALARSRKKVRMGDARVSNDRASIPRVEDSMTDDEEIREEEEVPPRKSYKLLKHDELGFLDYISYVVCLCYQIRLNASQGLDLRFALTSYSYCSRFEIENQPLGEKVSREVRKAPSFSGPLMLPNRASTNSLLAPIKSSGGLRRKDKWEGC
ncbi:hypothetical protein K1719_012370 [Acacia pycnantha]|nr:hypothetical protein K1719_012370 [Acacia pycnantha]